MITALFGAGWGCAAVLFGLGVDTVGLALGYAIILGLGTFVGSLLPLVSLHHDKLWAPAGIGTIASVVMLIASVVLFSGPGSSEKLIFKRARTRMQRVSPGALEGGTASSRAWSSAFSVAC